MGIGVGVGVGAGEGVGEGVGTGVGVGEGVDVGVGVGEGAGDGVGCWVLWLVCTGKTLPLCVNKPSLEYSPVYAVFIVFPSKGMRISEGLMFTVSSELSLLVTKS